MRLVIRGKSPTQTLLCRGTSTEITEGDDANWAIGRQHRKERHRSAHEGREHRPTLEAEPAFLFIEEAVERRRIVGTSRCGDALVE